MKQITKKRNSLYSCFYTQISLKCLCGKVIRLTDDDTMRVAARKVTHPSCLPALEEAVRWGGRDWYLREGWGRGMVGRGAHQTRVGFAEVVTRVWRPRVSWYLWQEHTVSLNTLICHHSAIGWEETVAPESLYRREKEVWQACYMCAYLHIQVFFKHLSWHEDVEMIQTQSVSCDSEVCG